MLDALPPGENHLKATSVPSYDTVYSLVIQIAATVSGVERQSIRRRQRIKEDLRCSEDDVLVLLVCIEVALNGACATPSISLDHFYPEVDPTLEEIMVTCCEQIGVIYAPDW